MEIFLTLIKGILSFIIFVVIVYLPSFILVWWDTYKETKQELKRDIESQEEWYNSIRR